MWLLGMTCAPDRRCTCYFKCMTKMRKHTFYLVGLHCFHQAVGVGVCWSLMGFCACVPGMIGREWKIERNYDVSASLQLLAFDRVASQFYLCLLAELQCSPTFTLLLFFLFFFFVDSPVFPHRSKQSPRRPLKCMTSNGSTWLGFSQWESLRAFLRGIRDGGGGWWGGTHCCGGERMNTC